LTAGIGEAALMDRAPHPNAANVFANWIASKEGPTVSAKARGEAPTRNDVDEASFLSREIIPRPGINYFDTYAWEFTETKKEAVKLRSERAAGVYTADILFGGSDTMATIYYAEKMVAPLKPELFLPEAVDPTKWRGGKLWFTDPEENYVLRLFNTVGPAFHI